jgi:hypothetical protein
LTGDREPATIDRARGTLRRRTFLLLTSSVLAVGGIALGPARWLRGWLRGSGPDRRPAEASDAQALMTAVAQVLLPSHLAPETLAAVAGRALQAAQWHAVALGAGAGAVGALLARLDHSPGFAALEPEARHLRMLRLSTIEPQFEPVVVIPILRAYYFFDGWGEMLGHRRRPGGCGDAREYALRP